MTLLPECAIINYILKANIYNKYIEYISINKDYKELDIIYRSLKELHTAIPDTDKSLDELETFINASYTAMPASQREAIGLIFEQLRSMDMSESVLEVILDEIQQHALSQRIAVSALEYAEGRKSWDSFIEDVASLKVDKASVSSDIVFVTDDLEYLKEHTVSKKGLPWRLESLNRSLGSLRGGDFGFVFARPERGKTTFLASETTYMAQFAEGDVIWFNNSWLVWC